MLSALLIILLILIFPGKAAADDGIDSCIGMTAAEARAAAESMELDPRFRSSDGKDVTEAVLSGGDEAVSGSKVSSASRSWHLFARDSADFTLEYSVEGGLRGCIGLPAEQAAAAAASFGYSPRFYSRSDTDVSGEVVGETAPPKQGSRRSQASISDGSCSRAMLPGSR